MSKIFFEGVLALKRASLVLTFRTVYSARLQEKVTLVITKYLIDVKFASGIKNIYVVFNLIH